MEERYYFVIYYFYFCHRKSHATATTSTIANEGITDVDPVPLILATHRLGSLSLTTAWRWMRLLGFHYDARMKSIYVDGHEREDVVTRNKKFCREYLTKYKPFCYRWVQVSLENALAINGLDLQFGYHHVNIIAGTSYIELHVDYWNRFSATTEAAELTRKPTLSIQVSLQSKPIMIIGPDESVFA
jgi:hypothetical protein